MAACAGVRADISRRPQGPRAHLPEALDCGSGRPSCSGACSGVAVCAGMVCIPFSITPLEGPLKPHGSPCVCWPC